MTAPGDNPVNPLYAKIIGFEGNAIGWARDATLVEILNRSDLTNTILSEYVKKVAPDLTARIERAESKSVNRLAQKIDEQTEQQKAVAKDNRQKDIDQEQAIYDLKNTLRGRLDTIGSVLRAKDSTDLASILGQGIGKAGESAGEGLGRYLGGTRGAVIGKVIGIAAGAVIGAALTRTLEISKTFRELYDTGVSFNGSMIDMVEAARTSGQTIETMSAQISKFSDTAAAIGSGRMVKFGKQMLDATRAGAEFGMTNDELREKSYQYLEIQMRTGQLANKTQKDLEKGAYDYLQNLTGLSLLTGKSRKAEAEAQKARASQALTRAAVQLMTPQQRDQLNKLMQAVPQEMQELVTKMYAEQTLGKPIMTAEERGALQVFFDRDKMAGFRTAMGNMSTSVDEFRVRAIDTFGTITDSGATFTLVNNRFQAMGKSMYDMNLTTAGAKKRIDELLAEQPGITPEEISDTLIKERKIREDAIKITENTNKIEQGLATVKSTIDQGMISSTTTVIEQLDKLGGAINDVLKKIGIDTGLSSTALGAAGTAIGGAAAYGAGKYAYNRLFSPSDIPEPPKDGTAPEPPKSKGAKSKGIRAGMRAGGPAAIAGIGLGLAGGAASSAGYEKTGAALDIGSYAASGAGLGAMMGAPFAGIGAVPGAAIGGALGTAYGLLQNWETLFSGGKPIPPTPTVEPATKGLGASTAIAEAARAEATAPGVTATPLDPTAVARKTMEYYETARAASQNMVDLLAQLNEKIEQLTDTTRDQTSDLSRSFSNVGDILRNR